jgi:hypothetical protein
MRCARPHRCTDFSVRARVQHAACLLVPDNPTRMGSGGPVRPVPCARPTCRLCRKPLKSCILRDAEECGRLGLLSTGTASGSTNFHSLLLLLGDCHQRARTTSIGCLAAARWEQPQRISQEVRAAHATASISPRPRVGSALPRADPQAKV